MSPDFVPASLETYPGTEVVIGSPIMGIFNNYGGTVRFGPDFITCQIDTANPVSYADWAPEHDWDGHASSPLADPLGRGMSNLLAYFHGNATLYDLKIPADESTRKFFRVAVDLETAQD